MALTYFRAYFFFLQAIDRQETLHILQKRKVERRDVCAHRDSLNQEIHLDKQPVKVSAYCIVPFNPLGTLG